MKKKPEDLTLEYINGRIDRLHKKFRKIEDLLFKWKREDRKDIDKLMKMET